MRWINTSVQPTDIKREVISPEAAECVATNYTQIEISSENKKPLKTTPTESHFDYINVKREAISSVTDEDSQGHSHVQNSLHQIPLNAPIVAESTGVLTRNPSGQINAYPIYTRHMLHYRPPAVQLPGNYHLNPGTQLIPIQYVTPSTEVHTPETIRTTGQNSAPVQQFIVPHIPNILKRPADVMYPVPIHIPVVSDKRKSPTPQNAKIQKTDLALKPLAVPVSIFPSEHPWHEKYMTNIDVQLESKELWKEFHQFGTEMILTRVGR